MMRFAIASGIAGLLLAAAPAVRAEEGSKDVQGIIAKAIEATGGAANIDKHKAFTAKFKGKFHGAGLEADMTGTAKAQPPDRNRVEAALDAGGQAISFVSIYDGKKGWVAINGNADEMDKDALHESRETVHAERLARLHGLSDKNVKLTPLGASKVGDKAAVGVKVSCEGYRDVNLYFDKDKGLLLRSETKGKDPMNGDEFTQETVYSDYKKVNDVMVPHKVEIKRDGKPYMEMERTSITVGDKLDDKDFEKP